MSDLSTSMRLFLVTLLVCSVTYPALVLAFAAAVVPELRQGGLVRDEQGKVIGSRLIAQTFTRPEYFWPRPSACDYNASAAGGSNLSPTNAKITVRAKDLIGRLRPGRGELVPADLVTASGSGLDPHISLAAALFQAPRVAAARHLAVEQVEDLVNRHTNSPMLAKPGGEPIVNVLELNVALDRMVKSEK